MSKVWRTVNVQKDNCHNMADLSTNLTNQLDTLSREGWEVHTILDNCSNSTTGRMHITIVSCRENENDAEEE